MVGLGPQGDEDWRTKQLRVIAVSDIPLIRQSIGSLLSAAPGIEVTEATEPARLEAAVAGTDPPDVVVLALTLTPDAGRSLETVVSLLSSMAPTPALLVIGPHRNGLARALVEKGPPRMAFLVDRNVPDVDSLARIVRQVCAGIVAIDGEVVQGAMGMRHETGVALLTAREYEVLSEVAEGLSNQAIARKLHITVKSVEANITQIFRKLGLEADGEYDRRVRAARLFSG